MPLGCAPAARSEMPDTTGRATPRREPRDEVRTARARSPRALRGRGAGGGAGPRPVRAHLPERARPRIPPAARGFLRHRAARLRLGAARTRSPRLGGGPGPGAARLGAARALPGDARRRAPRHAHATRRAQRGRAAGGPDLRDELLVLGVPPAPRAGALLRRLPPLAAPRRRSGP